MLTWLKQFFLKIWKSLRNRWSGVVLEAELKRPSTVRTAAELAVERVVMETSIAPDLVSAGVLKGGATIFIQHDRAKEAFIGRTYEHAADKAIEWLTKREGRFILQSKSTNLSRRNQKVFDAQRRDVRRQHRLNERERARKHLTHRKKH